MALFNKWVLIVHFKWQSPHHTISFFFFFSATRCPFRKGANDRVMANELNSERELCMTVCESCPKFASAQIKRLICTIRCDGSVAGITMIIRALHTAFELPLCLGLFYFSSFVHNTLIMFPLRCITYPWLQLNILARLWIQRGGGMNQSCLLAFLIFKHLMNWINVWQFLLQTAQWCIWSFPKKQLGFTETCNLIKKKWMLLRLIPFFFLPDCLQSILCGANTACI